MIGWLNLLEGIALIGAGYLLGAVPMGYLTIKLFKRQDITKIGSGRTGGTNAMRAGGVWVGALTGLLDMLKGYLAVQIGFWLMPGQIWVHAFSGAAAVIGHNWSLWLHLLTGKLSAGAGTGPNVGAAMAFWPPVFLVAVPIVLLCVFIIGYASVASLAVAAALVLIFVLRAALLGAPWQYIVFSTLTAVAVTWALRPNIQRLARGQERRVGVFATKKLVHE
jgi:glycerol-3-phosphate acyltransferase PlsY